MQKNCPKAPKGDFGQFGRPPKGGQWASSANEAVMLQHLTVHFQRVHQIADNRILFHKKTSNQLMVWILSGILQRVVPLQDLPVAVQGFNEVTHKDILLHSQ